jgi:hypothetical protein
MITNQSAKIILRDGYGRKIICRVKPYEGDIPKIRGLGQGNGQVWPHILGMSTTIRLYLL